jgi:hypothetical protein
MRFAFMMARTVRASETAASRGCWRKEGDVGKGAEGARGTNKVMVVVSETLDSVDLKVSASFFPRCTSRSMFLWFHLLNLS